MYMQTDLDKHWSAYYDKNADFRLIPSRLLTTMLEHTDQSLKKICLDIGCGTGQLTRELNHRGYECVGVDISLSAIRLAKSLTTRSDELHYLQFDIEKDDIDKLPIQPFSLITCKLVYAFIKDRAVFLDRVDKLLSPKGTFVVITPVHRRADEARPISVDFEATSHELRARFVDVAIVEEDGMVVFICHKD